MADKLNIFFIASWLPNKFNAFEGDFVYRHAHAISLFNKVTVVYVIEEAVQMVETEIETISENLEIYRIYLPKKYNSAIYKHLYYLNILKIFKKANKQKPIDLIHANVLWRGGVAAWVLHKKYKLPYIISEHTAHYNKTYYPTIGINAQPFLKKQLYKKVLTASKKVLCVSNFQAAHIKQFEPKINSITVSNVVDSSIFKYVNKNVNTTFTFLHVSMLTPEKNIDWLLKSIADLKEINTNFVLQLIGPISDALKQKINSLAIQTHVQLLNIQPYAIVASYMQQADAFIICSTQETQGCVAIESLCCGTPVIASNVGGIPEYVPTNSGILVDLNDMNSLTNAMQQMMQNYSIYKHSEISKEASKLFAYEIIGAQISKVYSQILSK